MLTQQRLHARQLDERRPLLLQRCCCSTAQELPCQHAVVEPLDMPAAHRCFAHARRAGQCQQPLHTLEFAAVCCCQPCGTVFALVVRQAAYVAHTLGLCVQVL